MLLSLLQLMAVALISCGIVGLLCGRYGRIELYRLFIVLKSLAIAFVFPLLTYGVFADFIAAPVDTSSAGGGGESAMTYALVVYAARFIVAVPVIVGLTGVVFIILLRRSDKQFISNKEMTDERRTAASINGCMFLSAGCLFAAGCLGFKYLF